jgi:DNA-binding MarR family transcriptional regulator
MHEDSHALLNQMLVETFNHILVLQEAFINQHIDASVTMNEVHLMEAIERFGSPTMAQVSQSMMVTPGTLSTSIKRMEKKGYVTRRQNKTDRRVYHLSITPKANQILAIHKEFHQRMIDGIVTNPDVDLQSVSQTLTALLRFFEELKKEYAK